MYYMYLIQCEDGPIYTGTTNNLERRMNVLGVDLHGELKLHGRKPVEFQIPERRLRLWEVSKLHCW